VPVHCVQYADTCNKPADTCDRLADTYDEPADTCNKPADTCDRLADTYDEPADTCNKPVNTCDRLADTCDEPADTCNKPADTCDKPAVDVGIEDALSKDAVTLFLSELNMFTSSCLTSVAAAVSVERAVLSDKLKAASSDVIDDVTGCCDDVTGRDGVQPPQCYQFVLNARQFLTSSSASLDRRHRNLTLIRGQNAS